MEIAKQGADVILSQGNKNALVMELCRGLPTLRRFYSWAGYGSLYKGYTMVTTDCTNGIIVEIQYRGRAVSMAEVRFNVGDDAKIAKLEHAVPTKEDGYCTTTWRAPLSLRSAHNLLHRLSRTLPITRPFVGRRGVKHPFSTISVYGCATLSETIAYNGRDVFHLEVGWVANGGIQQQSE